MIRVHSYLCQCESKRGRVCRDNDKPRSAMHLTRHSSMDLALKDNGRAARTKNRLRGRSHIDHNRSSKTDSSPDPLRKACSPIQSAEGCLRTLPSALIVSHG